MKKCIEILLISFIWASGNSLATDIEVMVLYPQDVADAYQIDTKIDSLIAYANQTFDNSDVDIELRLVHHGVVNLSGDEEVSSSLLGRVSNKDIDSVREPRNLHKPDLTVYLTYSSSTSCGIAYLPDLRSGRWGRDHFKKNTITQLKGSSVVGINCSTYVFAHEIGHNLGARHSAKQGDKGYPYADSRGWGVDSVFVTTMAYRSAFSDAPKVQYFSNPDIFECRNLPCGTSSSDAAEYIGQVAEKFVKTYSNCYPLVEKGLRSKYWSC